MYRGFTPPTPPASRWINSSSTPITLLGQEPQIEAQRAVKQLEAMAADENPAVQMVLPMAEMVGWLRKGVGELIRQAGLQLMDLLMQEEVRALAGARSQRQPERTAGRWGSERGYCVVM